MTDPTLFDYTIIRKPRLKHLYLRIRDGKLIVTANKRVSQKYIQQFVQSKATWIQAHLSKEKKKPLLTDPDATLYVLGKAFRIEVHIQSNIKKEIMKIEDDRCLFMVKERPSDMDLRKIRDSYYKEQCSTIITPIVEHYAQKMKLYPERISYRHNKSRWGSCSSKNTISLNSRLMMLPISVIKYVVVHELSHIQHKNHSIAFWSLVEKFSPDYKEERRRSRGFESAL